MSGYIINLPDDLLTLVLLRLPIHFLLRSRCVSKSWRDLIDSPHFTNLRSRPTTSSSEIVVGLSDQSTFFTLEFDSKNSSVAISRQLNYHDPESKIHNLFIGSCNGLLCFTNSNEDIILWNPLTQKHWELPSPPIEYSMGEQVSSRLGFGYDQVNDDYKVVSIIRLRDIFEESSDYEDEVYVYSLKLNRWRKIGEFSWKFPEQEQEVGAFSNGSLHWIVKKKQWNVVNLIAFLDLRNEEIGVMPCARDPNDLIKQQLRILNGNLCMISYYYLAGRYRVGISVMKEYGIEKSWTKLTTIKMDDYGVWSLWKLRPIMLLKNGRKLILQMERDNKLVVYDVLTRSMEDVSIDASPSPSPSQAKLQISCVFLHNITSV